MSLPFFDTLHCFFPNIRVDIIAKKSIQDVYVFHPAVTTIFPFAKSELKGPVGGLRYGRALQAQNSYDAFFTLTPSFSSAFIGYGTGAGYRLGYKSEGRSIFLTHSFALRKEIHQAQVYYELLVKFCRIAHADPQFPHKDVPKELPLFAETRAHALHFPFSVQEQQSSFLAKEPNTEYILFNVNSEAESRRLAPEKWIALGKRLLEDSSRKRRLLFSGIPAEAPRVKLIKDGIDRPDAILDYVGKTSLRKLALLLRDADLVVSNDSGPMHLANAVGTPLVTFLGAADPVVTAPFHAEHVVILNKFLECSPCVKNVCRFPTVRCLEQISADEIYGGIMKLLNERPERPSV
ncbi:MAG: glycosyltransferase family 9 protein [bacterium]|nr:glycosyltransferase family 9 protein [bacterium]